MTSWGQNPPTLQQSDKHTAFRQLLEVETHKSLHICTDKCDWMLYPWLPSHVICIIFITKPYSVFLFFSCLQASFSHSIQRVSSICEGMKTQRGASTADVFLIRAWRANELHVRRCRSRWSLFHLFCLAALRDKCWRALVGVLLWQLFNFS